MLALFYALTIACQPPPRCDGALFLADGLYGDGDCKELLRHESYASQFLGLPVHALAGWTYVNLNQPEGIWYDEDVGSVVGGTTYCADKIIYLGRYKDGWRGTSLAHEIIHAALECPWVNKTHEGWKEHHYQETIDAINKRPHFE